MTPKTCVRCQLEKSISGNKKICDDCRANEWYESKAERWLYSQVERAGIEVLPESTDELVEVLELRKLSIKASMGGSIEYQVGHRYPAKKGGKLVASNLIVIPKFINTKLGDNHGEGLESFKVSKLTNASMSEFRRLVMCRYDMSELAKYKNSDYFGEPTSNGMTIRKVKELEFQRLGLDTLPYEPNLSNIENLALDFASACNGECAFWEYFGKEASEARNELIRQQNQIMSECSYEYSSPRHEGESVEFTSDDYDYAIKIFTQARELDDRGIKNGNGRYFISLGAHHPSHFDMYGYRHSNFTKPMYRESFYKLTEELFSRLDMNQINIDYYVIIAVLEADKLQLTTKRELNQKLFAS